jgi:hypothetical protein
MEEWVICPVCDQTVKGDELFEHFLAKHGRLPSEGEIYRLRHPGKKRGGYKKTGKSIVTVQGGLPSLGKRR